MVSRLRVILLLLLTLLTLSACSLVPNKQSFRSYKEQFYVNARLNFAIKHPLDWQQQVIPVASPEYRADTVAWVIKDLPDKTTGVGRFLVISTAAAAEKKLPELLDDFLATLPELNSKLVENIDYPAGAALKLLGHDDDRGHLTIALKGRQRDFIISLDFPSNRFDELLPIFEETVESFVEIDSPNPDN